MLGTKISVSLLLTIQLSFWLIPETVSLSPGSSQKYRSENGTLENLAGALLSNATSRSSAKHHAAQRPVAQAAPVTQQHKSYIVLLNDQVVVSEFVATLSHSWESGSHLPLSKNQIGYVYQEIGFNGFSALLDDQAFKSLSRSAGVSALSHLNSCA